MLSIIDIFLGAMHLLIKLPLNCTSPPQSNINNSNNNHIIIYIYIQNLLALYDISLGQIRNRINLK